jgi:hypothetical protein
MYIHMCATDVVHVAALGRYQLLHDSIAVSICSSDSRSVGDWLRFEHCCA